MTKKSSSIRWVVFALLPILYSRIINPADSLSMKANNDNDPKLFSQVSRRQLLTWPIGAAGAVVYGKLVADAVQKLSRGDLVYPDDHERRVASTFSQAIVAAIPQDTGESRPLRVLEVGIGQQWRTQRRGLYKETLEQLGRRGLKNLHLTGVDIATPNEDTLQDVRRRFGGLDSSNGVQVDVNVVQDSITSGLAFSDGWFDCVICALTLCSVDDQDAALNEIKRLVRPDGGTFGYVEHVAVDPDEPYRLLSLQQEILDPLQQIVAENCHLHRPTEENIALIFGAGGENKLANRFGRERFLVDGMWPVSCQCCGVVQRTG